MSDPALRAALFRFVDVRPACATPADVTRHLHELLAEAEGPARAPGPASRPQARHPPGRRHRRHGRQADGPALHRRRRRQGLAAHDHRPVEDGVDATVDLLGEATVSEAEADRYMQRCEDALRTLAAAATKYPDRDVNLSVKVSALTPLLRPEAPERGIEGARPRLRHLLRRRPRGRRPPARRHGVLRHARGDHPPHARPAVGARVRRRPVRRHRPAGLPRRLARVPRRADRLGRATPRTQPFTIRLVKGAYWDHGRPGRPERLGAAGLHRPPRVGPATSRS